MGDPRIADAWPRLPDYLGNHILVCVISLVLGLAISLPLALACRHRPALRAAALGVTSVVQTIPGLALLALFYPVLLALAALTERAFGFSFSALGLLPSVLALTLYSMLPVLRNTIAGLDAVDPAIKEAAVGAGMTPRQSLVMVEWPLALPDHHGRHSHCGRMGDRRRNTVNADRPDQPRQLHLHRTANAELGIRAVRLRCRRSARDCRRSVARADRDRRGATAARISDRRSGGARGSCRAIFPERQPRSGASYVVGAKPFAEQYILAALIEQRLAAQWSLRDAPRRSRLGGHFRCPRARRYRHLCRIYRHALGQPDEAHRCIAARSRCSNRSRAGRRIPTA